MICSYGLLLRFKSVFLVRVDLNIIKTKLSNLVIYFVYSLMSMSE